MLCVTYKPFMLSVIMLSVVAPFFFDEKTLLFSNRFWLSWRTDLVFTKQLAYFLRSLILAGVPKPKSDYHILGEPSVLNARLLDYHKRFCKYSQFHVVQFLIVIFFNFNSMEKYQL